MLGASANAQASTVTLGSSLAPSTSGFSCGVPCSLSRCPEKGCLQSPVNGVAVRWQIRGGQYPWLCVTGAEASPGSHLHGGQNLGFRRPERAGARTVQYGSSDRSRRLRRREPSWRRNALDPTKEAARLASSCRRLGRHRPKARSSPQVSGSVWRSCLSHDRTAQSRLRSHHGRHDRGDRRNGSSRRDGGQVRRRACEQLQRRIREPADGRLSAVAVAERRGRFCDDDCGHQPGQTRPIASSTQLPPLCPNA